jgi:sn-glycerol 3-phosphate transport system substrate-binding protein
MVIMKKSRVLLLLLVMLTVVPMLLMAASPAAMQSATATPLPTITSVPALAKPDGAVEVTFWYGLGGLLGNVVQETVNKYNASQNKYYIKAVFQSSYDDTINKINAGLASGDLPNLAQVFEAGTQRMIDTKKIIPVQELFTRDGLQSVIDDMEPAVRANYTVNGTLYSAPFNSSTAMLYIDRKAFQEAGLDPDKTLVTFDDVSAAAQKLVKTDASGKTVRYGMALYAEGWFFEQIHAVHDTLMGEPANGRQARMSKYAYNNPVAVQWLDFQKKMINDGSAVYFGPGGGGSSAATAAYAKGEAAMVFSSIASLRTLIASAERSGAGVEVGTLYMPRRPDAKGKTIVGGASLWITNVGSPEQQAGAWDFVKWALTPEVQAFWAANTGYYPVVRASYNQQEMKDALVKYPQFQVAIDQLRLADITDANTAHISGTFVSMRTDVVKAMDDYFTGKAANAQEALDAALATSNEKLEEYNSTVE